MAPIVGRADLLCGLFAVAAFTLALGSRNASTKRPKSPVCARGCSQPGRKKQRQEHCCSCKQVDCGKQASTRGELADKPLPRAKRERNSSILTAGATPSAKGTTLTAKTMPTVNSTSAETGLEKITDILAKGGGSVETVREGKEAAMKPPRRLNTTVSAKIAPAVPSPDSNSWDSLPTGNVTTEQKLGTEITTAVRLTSEAPSSSASPLFSQPLASTSVSTALECITNKCTAVKEKIWGGAEKITGERKRVRERVCAGSIPPSLSRSELALVREKPKYRTSLFAKDSGPGVVRFTGALFFAGIATLCKEVGVTVFGLIAGAEVVRFLGESGWQTAVSG